MSNNFRKKIEKNCKILTLNNATVSQRYIVAQCHLGGEAKTRVLEMGLTPNTIIWVQKKAPLGDPLQIAVRGYSLCMRSCDAEMIEIMPYAVPNTEFSAM